MTADHYAVLGAPPDAGLQQLRAAYLRVMRACHPDLRPGDAAAANHARRANEAWAVLGDERRRAAYDRQRLARGATAAPTSVPPASAASIKRRRAFGRDFHRACVKGGAAVFAVGLLLLALTG